MPEPTPFPPYDAFRQALRDLGYVEGLTIILDPRWPVGRQTADYLEIAREFVQHGVDVIVTGHTVSTLAAKEATTTIPIVVAAFAGDPVQLGFAKSIARPGYNITGMSLQSGDLPGKRLDLIKKLVPVASRIAMLVVDTDTYRAAAKDHEAPAHTLGIQLVHLPVRGPSDFETAFEEAKRGQVDAMVLVQSALFYANSRIIAELSLKYRLPVLSGESGFAAAGGLMNHGPNSSDSWRRSATLVDKIVKGAKPGDLPIEQPTKFELVVNLKTAKALGLTVPPSLLIQADEVIE